MNGEQPKTHDELQAENDDLRHSLADAATTVRSLREAKDSALQDRANYEQAAREEKARADGLAVLLDRVRVRIREAVNELGG